MYKTFHDKMFGKLTNALSEANYSALWVCSNPGGCHWTHRLPSRVSRAFSLTIDLLSGTKPVAHILPLPLYFHNHALTGWAKIKIKTQHKVLSYLADLCADSTPPAVMVNHQYTFLCPEKTVKASPLFF